MLCLFLCTFLGFSQNNASISSVIDTNAIKIGEQIRYTITVAVDSTDYVNFPEGQTFSPLETVEAIATDTTKEKNRFILQKIYALTQFDSGAYTIPQQRIEINKKPFLTDSFRIKVADIKVDTLTQKLFDIKPLRAVEKSNSQIWKIVLGILGGLIILAALLYWFVWKKKPLTEEEKVALLPPYDRALLELKKLENSKFLIQDEYKAYYSQLTDIVRSYLEEDAHVSALESTTGQLISKLELMKDAGDLKLEDDTIKQFSQILQTADLVKFAKSKPSTSVAEEDRKLVEQIVVKTHDALPEPTEEELLEQEEHVEKLIRKKRRKRLYIGIAAIFGILVIASSIAIYHYGFSYLKDTVLGHPTKELLEDEWVSSSYGFPPIQIETPKVLVRQAIDLPLEAQEVIKEIQAFSYRSPVALFTVATTSISFKEPIEPPFDKTIEEILNNFEKLGARNIITKREDFETISGVKGVKIYGTGKFKLPNSKKLLKGKYTVLLFGGKGFQQYVILTWLDGDDYAEDIVDKIILSVDVKTQL